MANKEIILAIKTYNITKFNSLLKYCNLNNSIEKALALSVINAKTEDEYKTIALMQKSIIQHRANIRAQSNKCSCLLCFYKLLGFAA